MRAQKCYLNRLNGRPILLFDCKAFEAAVCAALDYSLGRTEAKYLWIETFLDSIEKNQYKGQLLLNYLFLAYKAFE